jgi:hypothetical protein
MFLYNNKNNFIYPFLATILLILFWLIFPARLPIIFETHFFVANLNNSENDIINQFYLLLKTPIYNLFEFVFLNPKIFFFASFIIEFLFSIVVFFFLYNYSKSATSSFICIIIFGPLFNEVLETILGIKLFQNLSSMGWGTAIFSVRYFIGFSFIISIFCYLKKKYYLGIFFVSLSLLSHPNSGIFIISIFIFYELYLIIFKSEKLNKLFLIILLSLICLIPTFINIINLESINSSKSLSNFEWYSNMLRDEVDDFSLLFNILNHPITIALNLMIMILTAIFYFLFEKRKNRENTFLILITIIIIIQYIIFIGIELSLSYLGYLLTPLLISLQPGYKLLSFSIFPLMFFWCIYFSILLKRFVLFANLINFFFIIIFILSLIYSLNSLTLQMGYLKKLSKIKIDSQSYFNTLVVKSKMEKYENPIIPKIYLLKNLDLESLFKNKRIFEMYDFNKKNKYKLNSYYHNSYNHINVFEELNNLIRNNIKNKSSIIIPPYLFHLRDAFPDYKIFLQEHHDGNLAMGNKKIYEEINKRMILLLGINYLELPVSQPYELNFSYMRNLYLKRNENDFKNLKKFYSEYDLLITESSHFLNFEIISKNDQFIIYKIN